LDPPSAQALLKAAEIQSPEANESGGWRRAGAWIVPAGATVCLLLQVPSAIALFAGIAVALVLGNPLADQSRNLAQTLLKISVVGLGAGMNLGAIWRLGVHDFGYTVISIGATLGFGLLLGRWARLHRDVALLVAAGTAICGGSAIAAIAGVIRARHSDVTVSLTAVFVLNAVALVIFPPIGHALGFSDHQFGLWAALAIHDTSSVVGAAIAYGHESVAVATTVKLVRALWIVPVALGVGLWWPRTDPVQKGRGRLPVPAFILGFIATAALFTYCAPLLPLGAHVTAMARRLFAVTLFLIGCGFSRQALVQVGLRPLLVGVVLWACVAATTAGALLANWIQ
jgi:uncharacterized integral membrane protein (TIGR00698 family)